MRSNRTAHAALLALLAPSAAYAIGPEVIFTKIPGHPTAAVPGALDLSGNPTPSDFRALEDLMVTPDGSRWMIKGRTQLGSDLENILILGQGSTRSNFAQEGQPIPSGSAGELYDFFGSGVGRFDDNGNFAFSARSRGTSTLQKVLYWNGSTFSTTAVQGQLYTGLQDLVPNPSGDETVGNSIGSIHPLNDGRIGAQDSSILNIHTTRRPAIFYNLAAFHQTNVTNINGFMGGFPETWKTINANAFYTSPDGAHWIAIGQVNQTTDIDTVLVHDGTVVLQEGKPLPGASLNLSTIVTADIASDGSYVARGAIAAASGGGVYAVRNGAVIAKTGDSVTGGAELWGSSFLSIHTNASGDWVLVGNTNNPNLAQDQILVLNGTTVLAREGDPIDLDGNGMFDDNVFIGRNNPANAAFETNDLYITNSGDVYVIANLVDGAGNELNSSPAFTSPQALLRIRGACPGDVNGDRVVNFADLNIVLSFFGQNVTPGTNGDLNGDGMVNFTDLNTVLSFFGTSC